MNTNKHVTYIIFFFFVLANLFFSADMTEQKGNVVIPKSRVEEIFGTPKECFDFLTIEVGYHLPDRPYCDMSWMSQVSPSSRDC